MKNKFRLHSEIFDRETEEEKIDPEKIYFISVEGNVTEREYFNGVSLYRNQLGIHAKVDIEVLGRNANDTNSAPEHVIELLEEYLSLREEGHESLIKDIPEYLINEFGIEFIQRFLNDDGQLSSTEKKRFIVELKKIGYDIQYRKYLLKYDNAYDEFCILIDRDAESHSMQDMKECIEYCRDNNYKCYVSNPCFEFWLLLHHSDVKEEYACHMNEIKRNPKVSQRHSFVSKELASKVHHGKKGIKFKDNYLPYIDLAIIPAKEFANDEMNLIENVGSNIWKLFEEMRKED